MGVGFIQLALVALLCLASTQLSAAQGSPYPNLELVYLAGGCFWGLELAILRIPGVQMTRVGYAGGHTKQPTYEQVPRQH